VIEYTDFEIYDFIRALEDARPNFYWLALCRANDVSEFFPGRGQSSKIKKAVEICLYCPVQQECLEYALKNEIEHGVWGGSTPERRTRWIKEKISAHDAWLEIDLGFIE